MKRTLQYIALFAMLLWAFAGCDVHEFPVEEGAKIPYTLNLVFDNPEILPGQEVVYSEHEEDTKTDDDSTKGNEDITKGVDTPHYIRYTISAYRTDNTRGGRGKVSDYDFTVTKPIERDSYDPAYPTSEDLNHRVTIYLPEGTYDFGVWMDYIETATDREYYNVDDVTKITIYTEDYSGNNNFRDAFRGALYNIEVLNPAYYTGAIVNEIHNEATVDMSRPLGKFRFIATDVEPFLNRVAEMLREQGLLKGSEDEMDDSKSAFEKLLQSIDLGEFYAETQFNYYWPNAYHIFDDGLAGSEVGMSFTSPMEIDSDGYMSLGFDYILAYSDNSGIIAKPDVTILIKNKQGETLSSARVTVPIERNKVTTVKGDFLTSSTDGGIAINPEFEGDFYIPYTVMEK